LNSPCSSRLREQRKFHSLLRQMVDTIVNIVDRESLADIYLPSVLTL
jgi:hypothetical protein